MEIKGVITGDIVNKITHYRMRKILLALLCITTLNCYSQETWKMQIWNKDGSKIQYAADDIDSISFARMPFLGKWENTIFCPTSEQISLDNDTSNCRAPYITAVLQTSQVDSCYIGYSIDFKADFLPLQTYCGLASFTLDYSSSGLEYDSIKRYGRSSGYAGFQRINKKGMPEYISLLSIWDNYFYKGEKLDTIIIATQISPTSVETAHYNDEGEYVSYRPEYLWKPGRWYRMLLLLGTYEENGNTTIEQKVYDLETKEMRSLCAFDLGLPNLKIRGNMYAFLEDWKKEKAGEIRTMEIKNAKILTLDHQWKNVTTAFLTDRKEKGYSGSHNFGKDESSFWMITTGVPGCAHNPDSITLTVEKSEEGNPEIVE